MRRQKKRHPEHHFHRSLYLIKMVKKLHPKIFWGAMSTSISGPPCIKEIPFLQKLEEDYADKNIKFVSISIDKPNQKEKWLKMIEDKSLGGIQLFVNEDFKKNVFTSFYNIIGIPRFILLDPKGKIISAKADQPSNPNIRHKLDELLVNRTI